nr:MAG TPA: hypothetical protein [Caudoviricetes sp.]
MVQEVDNKNHPITSINLDLLLSFPLLIYKYLLH